MNYKKYVDMEKKTFTLIVSLLLIALCVSLYFNYQQYTSYSEDTKVISDITVVEYREIKDTMPDIKEENVVGKIKIRIPQENPRNSEKLSENDDFHSDFSENLSENQSKVSEMQSDSIGNYIEVDRVQRVYEDSAYTAYVSGYEPSLDSIVVRQKEIYRTITELKTITKKDTRRINVGLQVGYGYGISSKQFEPYIGVGLTVNIFK